jgi:hypothetical protein
MPIFKLISKVMPVVGYDINPNLLKNDQTKYETLPVRFLHICIPFNSEFRHNVLKLAEKFKPEGIIIHSTIEPQTTNKLRPN